MLAARNAAVPDAWENGIGSDPPVVVYGEHAHYAVTRAIGQLGIGRRAGISIPSHDYKINVSLLVNTLDRLREGKTRDGGGGHCWYHRNRIVRRSGSDRRRVRSARNL